MSNGITFNCTNCKFFHEAETPTGFPGECRRYPPVQHSQDSKYSYTPVSEATWCGEYEPDISG